MHRNYVSVSRGFSTLGAKICIHFGCCAGTLSIISVTSWNDLDEKGLICSMKKNRPWTQLLNTLFNIVEDQLKKLIVEI